MSDSGARPRERVLPTGAMDLVFRVDATGRAAATVVGPRSASAMLDAPRPFSVIGVHFKPGGGWALFGMPADELRDQSVALDAVWGAAGASVRDRLWEAVTPEERYRILEDALLDRGRGRLRRHPAVEYALGVFDRSAGGAPIGDVVRRTGLSSRRFVELFAHDVGLTPKLFCRIRRFGEVLARLDGRAEVDWAGVALSCGYFDQAHFIHDFRAFSGVTPSTYLRDRTARLHVAVRDARRAEVPCDRGGGG
jgi:AraC-like DNA-binding protein